LCPFRGRHYGPSALVVWGLGLAAGKTRCFSGREELGLDMGRWLPYALTVVLIGNAIYATASAWPTPAPDGGNGDVVAAALVRGMTALTAPALTYVYIVALVAATRSGRMQRWMGYLRSAGRMSLTNYLGQSVLAGALAYGWGAGLFGTIGLWHSLLLTPLIFGMLVVYSSVWMRWFRFGPLEWLLRCWTYLRWEPLRKR